MEMATERIRCASGGKVNVAEVSSLLLTSLFVQLILFTSVYVIILMVMGYSYSNILKYHKFANFVIFCTGTLKRVITVH